VIVKYLHYHYDVGTGSMGIGLWGINQGIGAGSLGDGVIKTYRYGFNGKEKDDEVYNADGTEYDYGMRIYDSRLARFLSVDPLFKRYPWNSTYAFAENDVIRCIDLDGCEKVQTKDGPVYGPRIVKTDYKDLTFQQKLSTLYYETPKPEPMFELKFVTKGGVSLEGEGRIFGYGAGGKIGESTPITTATFSDQGIKTSLGGAEKAGASYTLGFFSGSISTDASGQSNASAGAGPLKTSISNDGKISTELEIFHIAALFIIGADITLTMHLTPPSNIQTQPVNKGISTNDATSIAPIIPIPEYKPPGVKATISASKPE
jgi:RHS repeat-associated protein